MGLGYVKIVIWSFDRYDKEIEYLRARKYTFVGVFRQDSWLDVVQWCDGFDQMWSPKGEHYSRPDLTVVKYSNSG